MAATQNENSLCRALGPGAVLLVLFGGGCPAPGQGSKAEAGYRRAAPVIAALDRYHRAHGSYPATLTELPPAGPAPPPALPTQGLHYARRGDHYELEFSYTGPGVNHCTYDSAAVEPQRWSCRGYY